MSSSIYVDPADKTFKVRWQTYKTFDSGYSVIINAPDENGEILERHPLHPIFRDEEDINRWVEDVYIPRLRKINEERRAAQLNK